MRALLQQLAQQQRQERHDLVDRTRDAMAATRSLPKEERDRARAEVLSEADAEREALFAAQREARQALQTRLEEIRAERSGLEPLIDTAKERGVETSRERRGEGRR
ncbi:MAG: hypothetical protein JNK85_08060 [Verrucomicrobiales bacterium]|nr:hypothetical protein [Verrucomicrobiales bacterium]